MKPAQTASKSGQREPDIPPLDAEELYRRYLRLRAEENSSKNTMAGIDLAVTKLRPTNREDGLSYNQFLNQYLF